MLAAGFMLKVEPLPPLSAASVIRATPAFRIRTGLHRDAGNRLVVVEAVHPSAASRAALARLHALHADPPHARIARAIAYHDDATPAVSFASRAELDLESLMGLAASRRIRIAHEEADGFVVTLRDALRAAARRGVHIGTLTFGNVLFARDGSFEVLGLGHNVVTTDEHGVLSWGTNLFQAPEVAVGGAPSESGDFVALLKLARGLLSYVTLAPSISRALAGNTLAEDAEMVRHILWIEHQVISASPDRRASIARTIRVSDRIRELVGVWPDPAAFERRARQLIDGTIPSTELAPLRVRADGSAFQRRGEDEVDLATRPLLARLLAALVQLRGRDPAATLSVGALQAVGWPSERMVDRSGANRVYVSINALRRAGLGSDLERHLGGYRLRPDTPIELELTQTLGTGSVGTGSV